jgi:NitT/TauT family transport system substrate-binding protein
LSSKTAGRPSGDLISGNKGASAYSLGTKNNIIGRVGLFFRRWAGTAVAFISMRPVAVNRLWTVPPVNVNARLMMSLKTRWTTLWMLAMVMGVMLGLAAPRAVAEPLKIAYSDWPGWVAWEIAIQKKWFEEEGVEVQFLWFDYVPSMDAYVAGQVDAVCMTNGDALVTGSSGKASVGIILNDFSNGNDMIVARPGINSVKDLKGKKVGIEEGFVEHLLLLKALQVNGMADTDVTIVNTPTNETPQVLKSGAVDAIGAWQPNSGQALKLVDGSKPIFTSADAPGIIYDLLFVSPESLDKRRADWLKVVKVWYRIVAYMQDEANRDDALKILSSRVSVKPEEYEPFLKGTYILNLAESLERWKKTDGLESVYGSTAFVNAFNVKFGVYKEPIADWTKYLDPSLTLEYAKTAK